MKNNITEKISKLQTLKESNRNLERKLLDEILSENKILDLLIEYNNSTHTYIIDSSIKESDINNIEITKKYLILSVSSLKNIYYNITIPIKFLQDKEEFIKEFKKSKINNRIEQCKNDIKELKEELKEFKKDYKKLTGESYK